MKNCLLALFLLITTFLNAQTPLPRAGEIPANDISKTELIQMMRTGFPIADEKLTVIDFDSSNTSFKGNFPFSISYALAMSDSGDLVFVGSGGGIFVTDVSDPQNPIVLSEIRTRSLVDRCTYDQINKRLYVCAYFSGIEIWDLSDLYNPTRMSRIPTEPYPRSGVAYSGDYLFFTTNYSLWTLDISDPYNPVVVEDLFIANNLIMQMYLKGEIIYIVTSTQGLKLVNVSDPLNLQLIASYGYISGTEFDISGDYLYAVNSSGVFTILNISDSLSVTIAGSLNIGGYPQDIVVFNNRAYISKASTDGGLQVVNVENPSSPTPITLYSGDYEFIAGIEDYVYLTRNSNFSVLDVTDSIAVQYVSGFEIPGFINDVSVSGNYAYTGSNGFRVIDISDSTYPVEIGYADIDGSLVEAADNSLVVYCPYSMTANNTVHLMDVSDPANPVSLDSYASPVMTWDLVVRDNLAFVACWWDGVRILSFDDPNNLVLISHTMGWQSGGIPGVDYCYAQAVDVDNNYLYIVDYGPFSAEDTYGLYIIDISNPADPTLINRFQNITSYPNDVKVKDGKVYIADGYGGVEVVDVSDPLNPSVMGYVDLIDGSTGITIEGNYAYVSEYILGGLQVVDISTPSSPTLAGWYQPSGCFALGVESDNGFVYIADGLAGFQIYRNLLVTPVPVELTSFTATANGKEVVLNWSTATEINNQGFEIQRSTEGEEFFTVGFVNGHGTTTEPQKYNFADRDLDNGKYYYRLKQVDYDGSYEYSDVVEVEWRAFNSYLLEQNYPNPFNPTTRIKYAIPQTSKVTLTLFDLLGEEVKTLVNEEKTAGNYTVEFNAASLPSGIYFYQLKAGEFVETRKMILLK